MDQNESIEITVLSGCLTPEIHNIRRRIKRDFFNKPFHKTLFDFCCTFYERNQIYPTKAVLNAAFEKNNYENKLEMEVLVSKLIDSVDKSLLYQRLDDLKLDYQLREIRSTLKDVQNPSIRDFSEISESLKKSIVQIETLCDDKFRVDDLQKEESIKKHKIYIDGLQDPDPKKRFYFGVESIDNVLPPGGPGLLYTYAAPTGQGKTTVLLNHAYNLAVQQKKNIIFAYAEMGCDQMNNAFYLIHAARAMGATDLDMGLVLKGLADKKQYDTLRKAADHFKNTESGRVFFINASGLSIQEIHIEAENINKETRVDAIFIDYFAKLKSPFPKEHVAQQIDDTYKYGEFLKNSFDSGRGVFLVTGHQINREGLKKIQTDEDAKGGFEDYHLYMSNEVRHASDAILGFAKADELPGADSNGAAETELIVSVIKNRYDSKSVKPFPVEVNWKTKYISSIDVDPDEHGRASFSKEPEILDFSDE